MGDDDQGGGLGGRLSIPMAGVPVPEDDEDGFARLSGLELDEALDALDADAASMTEVSASNPPPRLPPVSVRPVPPRAPLPVKRPGSVSSAPRERASNEPPVAFPPPPSEPPPGRGSGIDFEKVLATASMSPPPKPEAPTLDLAMAPPAPSMPVAPRSGGAGRTVGLVVLAAAAAFAVAWFLRAPEPEPLTLGPIAGAPTSANASNAATTSAATTNAGPSGAVGSVGTAEPAATEPSAIEATDEATDEASDEASANRPGGSEPSTNDSIPNDDTVRSAEAARVDATDTTRSSATDTTRSDTTRSDTTRSDTTRSSGTDTTRSGTTRSSGTDTTRSDTTPELVRVEPPPPVSPPPPPADLPEEPTREEVQAALSAIRPAVQSCVTPGAQVRVRITIASSGRVTTAVVEDDYWSRQPHGGCIARAVRTASFPRFARDRFVVVFPFQL